MNARPSPARPSSSQPAVRGHGYAWSLYLYKATLLSRYPAIQLAPAVHGLPSEGSDDWHCGPSPSTRGLLCACRRHCRVPSASEAGELPQCICHGSMFHIPYPGALETLYHDRRRARARAHYLPARPASHAHVPRALAELRAAIPPRRLVPDDDEQAWHDGMARVAREARRHVWKTGSAPPQAAAPPSGGQAPARFCQSAAYIRTSSLGQVRRPFVVILKGPSTWGSSSGRLPLPSCAKERSWKKEQEGVQCATGDRDEERTMGSEMRTTSGENWLE